MSEEKTYTIMFSTSELYSLRECLKQLRKRIDLDYQTSDFTQRVEPIKDPLFISACRLHFKLDKAEYPDTTVTLQDYLNSGNYGAGN